MAKFIDWGAPKSEGIIKKSGVQFLKLEPGKTYQIRLVGRPITFLQHWSPIRCRSPYMDDKGELIDPLMIQGFQPSERHSIWVFDRLDNNMLKLMDFSKTLHSQFNEWRKAFNDEPGGKNGSDWKISVTRNGSDTKSTKYMAFAMDRTPLTEAEIKIIKEVDIQKKLEELRKDNTPEEIRAMMANMASNPNGATKQGQQSTPATVANHAMPPSQMPASSPVSEDDDPLKF